MDATKPKSPRKDSKEKGQQAVTKKQKIPQLRIEYLPESRVEEAAHLFSYGFIEMNTMWKQLGVNYGQIYSVMRGRMVACCRAGWVYAMVNPLNNQLAAVVPSMDLIDYIDTKSMPNNSQFNKILGKYATELEKQYFQNLRPTLKRGDAVYNYGGTLQPKYANAGISKKLWAIGFVYLKTAGWKTYYCRATNRITTKIITSFGGKVQKVVPITEQGVKNQFLELIKFDLVNLSYNSLSKYYEEKPAGQDEEQF